MVEIVLGPPGTGKTTTLLRLVEEELQSGTSPERIGYVSFTRRAAYEAIDRAVDKFDYSREQFPWFRTLHSLCYRRLGISSSQMFAGVKTLREFSDYIGLRFSGRYNLSEGNTSGYEIGDRILFMDVLARIRRISLREQYNENDDGLRWSEVERVCRGYHLFKNERGLFDFNDVLEQFVERGVEPDLDVLFVDEAQDLSTLQWDVVWKLARDARRVVVAGDDDQAIYEWAGAAVSYFVYLQGEATVLDQSYRVPKKPQAIADKIISRVKHRRPKVWNPRDAEGEVNYIDLLPEETVLESPSCLILARNDFVLKTQVETRLRTLGVFYERYDNTSVSKDLITSILDWELLRSGSAVLPVHKVKKIYGYMSSKIGVARGFKTLPDFHEEEEIGIDALKREGGLLVDCIWHEAFDRVNSSERTYLLAMLRRGEKLRRAPRVRVSTIHGAKGGQADDVILFTKMATRTYNDMLKNPDAESRVWYVGVTRALERLHVVDSRSSKEYSL